MIKNDNMDIFLQKYEIKAPDYDYIERVPNAFDSTSYKSERYVEKNGVWKQRKKRSGLFSKKNPRIMFLGDITCFENQFAAAKTEDGYDFRYEFEKIKPVFQQADLVIGNLETMIFPNAPYRTEKYVAEQNYHCNGPIEFLDAVRYAGFDMVTNSNNHHLDTGAVGIGETIKNIERFGLIHTGTFRDDRRKFELVEVEGVKIAIVAMTSEHNNLLENLTEEGKEALVNDYSEEKARRLYGEAKAAGAEVVFMCIHWGKENRPTPVKQQVDLGQEIAEIGYDCIIGSHPHVLQPFTYAETTDGRRVPLFYSMGNFVSHNANNPKGRTIAACFEIVRKDDKLEILPSYIPIFTSNAYGPKKYVLLPLTKSPKNEKNQDRLNRIQSVIGEEIEISEDYSYIEIEENVELPPAKKKGPKPIITGNTVFPVEYDDLKFLYNIYEDYAEVTGFSPDAKTLSYSIPNKMAEKPVSKLSEGAFEGNELVRKINFRKDITFISNKAFKNCICLEGFQLGGDTVGIGEEAFAGCIKLGTVVLKSKIKSVGKRAFADCIELRCVKIPATVEMIEPDAFENCPKAIFYCKAGCYAEKYAKEHGIIVRNMDI